MWITDYPADALPKAEAVYSAADARRHGGTGSSRSTRSARTSAAACRSASRRSGSSARATARSTTRSARRRAARRRAAWTASPSRSPARRRHRRHRHRRPGPADRHQHHRPGGRGPALHHRRRGSTDAVRCWLTTTVDRAGSSSRSSSIGWIVYAVAQHRARRRPRSAPRSSWPPTASRTTTTRARGPTPRPRPARRRARCSSSSSSACRCTGCSSPSRQAGASEGIERAASSAGASELFAPTADGGFNCAGCHGGMKATGGVAPYTLTDPATGEVQAGRLEGAGAQHGAATGSTRTRSATSSPTAGPVSPMPAWGVAGGGPMNDQQIDNAHRLPQVDPDPARGLRAEEADDPLLRDAVTCPADDPGRHRRRAPRQSVEDGTYDSYGEALFNLDLASGAYSCARCHTHGWSYGDPRRAGPGRVRLEPHRRRRRRASSRTTPT